MYALLALLACGEQASPAARQGCAWLTRAQRADGGWPPRLGVDQSTWVTAMALLLPPDMLGAGAGRALQWLDNSTGREASWALRLHSLLVNGRADAPQGAGWPWFPDSGSWVTPTCFGVLALEKRGRVLGSPQRQQRCSGGREYLLTHRCRDGGWNHGSTRALGYDSDSYPETTGQALLALHGTPRERIASGIEKARAHVGQCKSVEALSWLRLGLSAHGQTVPDVPVLEGHGSVPEQALTLITEAAVNGRNVFLE